MKFFFSILISLVCTQAISQKKEKIIVSEDDPYYLYINDGDSTQLYYYRLVPKTTPKGVLTIIPSSGESTESVLSQITLHEEAVQKGFIVIIPSINWGTDNRMPEVMFLDSIFREVVETYGVSRDNFVFCGLSNGGMISLQYGVYAVRDSFTYVRPMAIIGIDPPVDFARLYRYCDREIARNVSEVGVSEAKWLRDNFNRAYGGSPDEFPEKYVEASTFSYGEEHGGNAEFLTHIPIRLISDLNVDFLLNQRQRDLYDWNGTDLVAMVNQLRMNGNTNAQVIITQNKGRRPNGNVHPHSWNILDTDDTLQWLEAILNE